MLKSILADSSDFREHGKFWTDAWSLVEGCTPVSPGCRNCWLAGMFSRNLPGMTAGLVERVNTGGQCIDHFNGIVRFRSDRLDLPLRARKPRVYAIWSDLFHEGVDDAFRLATLQVIHKADHHHFIAITKRPEVAARFLAGYPWLLPNLTLLVSMEDQQCASERGPYAFRLSVMRWRVGILAEPLLGPLDLSPWICNMKWLISGGESGHRARPAHPEWFRSLRDLAGAAGVPFLFKQWGEWVSVSEVAGAGAHHYFADGSTVRRVGKAKAGRFLDGREWLEVP